MWGHVGFIWRLRGPVGISEREMSGSLTPNQEIWRLSVSDYRIRGYRICAIC